MNNTLVYLQEFAKSFFTIIFCMFFLVFVHELGHGLAALATGNEFLGICFWFTEPMRACAYISYESKEDLFIILIAGSFISSLVACVIVAIGYKKTNSAYVLGGLFYIFGEICYWFITIEKQFGDGYMLVTTFGIDLGRYYGILFMILTIYVLLSVAVLTRFSKKVMRKMKSNFK